MVFRRKGSTNWWFEFVVAGRRYRETTRTPRRQLAERIERKRRHEIEESINGIQRRKLPPLFSKAAQDYLAQKRPSWAAKTYVIEGTNVAHLAPHFAKLLVTDITPRNIAVYQQARQDDNAANKTINNELGTLRAILRRHRLWAQLAPDIRMLPVQTDIGVALTRQQEANLLEACAASPSRSLHPAVTPALRTGLRHGELRHLQWRQVDLLNKVITVGRSKTQSGEGRSVPLNTTATNTLTSWVQQFPDRQPEHFVFPSERVGFSDVHGVARAYGTDPTKPITSWKVAWTKARKNAEVNCRFHDLRHTCVTRLLEQKVAFPVVASLMGWSPATTTRMAKRYAHFADSATRQAMETLDLPTSAEQAEADRRDTVQ